MPDFFVRFPCSREQPSRRIRIQEQLPGAKSALDGIERSTVDLKFGSPISAFLNNYHFPSDDEILEYFRVYLGERSDEEVDPGRERRHLAMTLNRRPADHRDSEVATHHAFRSIAADLREQIAQASRENFPLVKLIIGPTGAGKTAFSKSLFTVCQKDFWDAGIIPSRVEYTRYSASLSDDETVSDRERDRAFTSFVRRCQLRDLLIYLCASGRFDEEQKRDHLASLRLNGSAQDEVVDLLESTRGMRIDGKYTCLDSDVRKLFTVALDAFEDDCDRILRRLAPVLKVRFLVSFDGFDITKLEHFLFERRANAPIHYLVRTLKGIHEKQVFQNGNAGRLETHYLAYMRDTTFARLRTELFTSPKGFREYLHQWVVPPSYRLLVQNAAVYLTGSHDPAVNRARTFADDVEAAFDRAVFNGMDLDAATHLAFVFGSSGRRMKYHIRQLMFSTLQRASDAGQVDLDRRSGGIDAKTVWLELVAKHSLRELPPYLIREELFLDESRQLVPKLQLDPGHVSRRLAAGDFESLIAHIVDPDDANVIFGCVFNYFLQCLIEDEHDRQPGLLIIVRILQFIEQNPRCVAGHVHTFLRSIGYEISEEACHFCLFAILRSELVKWDGSRGLRLIGDVPLYITTTGRIAIEKLIFSVTYVSEAMLSSIMIDQALCSELRDRAADVGVWVADCIHNASLALYVIGRIERIEGRFARRNDIDLGPYLLHRRMKDALSVETRMIIKFARRKTLARYEDNRVRLGRLRATHRDFAALGEIA